MKSWSSQETSGGDLNLRCIKRNRKALDSHGKQEGVSEPYQWDAEETCLAIAERKCWGEQKIGYSRAWTKTRCVVTNVT